ncbi:unnamed protein product [Linum tenue]|uniref:ATP synthase F0 subunit 8 n=1 Tax=Linum tenue TaxID=586396 RepID=A0AAV0PFE1_9ROSI|nr:unnamed protein product [Linum tenue]
MVNGLAPQPFQLNMSPPFYAIKGMPSSFLKPSLTIPSFSISFALLLFVFLLWVFGSETFSLPRVDRRFPCE